MDPKAVKGHQKPEEPKTQQKDYGSECGEGPPEVRGTEDKKKKDGGSECGEGPSEA